MSLESKILAFMNAWGEKLGNSANKAISEAVDYSTGQAPDLQFDPSNSGVKFEAGKITYRLALNKDYWRFIQSGVNGYEKNVGSPYSFKKGGGRIPIKSLMGFIEKRNLRVKVKTGVKGKAKGLAIDKQRKSLAFAIGTDLKKKGIKPRPFTDKIMTKELNDELTTGIAKILGEEVVASFKTFE